MVSKKSKTNFFINGAMFFLMSFMTSSGLLMKFVLIPRSQRQEKFGRNVDLFLLGMDRHDWGTIHLVVGCVLIGLLARSHSPFTGGKSRNFLQTGKLSRA
jgi:hypothetical protein